jgi:hypothetical protein
MARAGLGSRSALGAGLWASRMGLQDGGGLPGRVAAAGDLILGRHVHVVQPARRIEGK